MTPEEVESCLKDFHRQHGTPPMLLIANALTFEELSGSMVGDQVTGVVYFAGVKTLNDPLIKGIVISS